MDKQTLLSLLKPATPEIHAIDLPDGATVHCRRLTLSEKDRWEEASRDEKTRRFKPDWRARFLALVLVDEQGNRLFNDQDWPLLENASNCYGEILFDASFVFNCGKAEDLEALKKTSVNGRATTSDMSTV